MKYIRDYFMKLFTVFLIFLFINVSCSANVQYSKQKQDKISKKFYAGQVLTGRSSYYADKFHGRKTANGDIFDMYKLTAAHKSLPFGTILNVVNLRNNKSIRVRVNDRGPFVPGRFLDLSYGAAKKIDLIKTGVTEIKATIIRLGED